MAAPRASRRPRSARGQKLVVDAYGARVIIGGGALNGKDFFKADREGVILAGECIAFRIVAAEARVGPWIQSAGRS